MGKASFKQIISDLLADAGVTVGGGKPWDIEVRDEKFYGRVLRGGSLALGEAYMDGWWDCERLDEFFCRILRAGLDEQVASWTGIPLVIAAKLINRQKKSRAFEVGRRHYDIGNDIYQAMLDKRMIYSCAYWQGAGNLDQAQENKLKLICAKLKLKAGMRVLDIGCGWGGLAKYMAGNHGVEVVGVTVSKEQARLAAELCLGLPVSIRLTDYRDISECFDRVVSIGMFEHVGCKNYQTFMKVARRCLKDAGLFLLHTIGGNTSCATIDPWIDRYIFPNAVLPSAKQIAGAAEGKFVIEDWHNFGADYDTTLLHWFANFDRNWPRLTERYGEVFYRMWKYYLLACAGSFRARENQVWQIVFSRRGVLGGYCPSCHRA